jgi:hypothetical protein
MMPELLRFNSANFKINVKLNYFNATFLVSLRDLKSGVTLIQKRHHNSILWCQNQYKLRKETFIMNEIKITAIKTTGKRNNSTVLYRNKQGTCVASSSWQPGFGLFL